MKFAVAFLAVLAVANAATWQVPSAGSGALAKDLQEFLDIIPVNQLVTLTKKYELNDKQFQSLVQLLKNPELKQLIADLEALPRLKEAVDYLQRAGVDAKALLKKLNDAVGIKSAALSDEEVSEFAAGGLKGYLEEVIPLIPTPKLIALYKKKLATSKVFADTVGELRSPKYHEIRNALTSNKHGKNLIQSARNAGLPEEELKIVGPIALVMKVYFKA